MSLPIPDQTCLSGLSQADAQARLQAEGPNELPSIWQRNIRAIALEVLREPMFLPLVSTHSLVSRNLRYQLGMNTGSLNIYRQRG